MMMNERFYLSRVLSLRGMLAVPILVLWMSFNALALAPVDVIKGKVTDAAGVGIPGVTVKEKGTNNATFSNENG